MGVMGVMGAVGAVGVIGMMRVMGVMGTMRVMGVTGTMAIWVLSQQPCVACSTPSGVEGNGGTRPIEAAEHALPFLIPVISLRTTLQH